jgi:uncharacterized protein YbaR (Trm112 family)
MYKGFPISALNLLCCPRDGGALYGAFDAEFVQHGTVSCRQCAMSYPIEAGIIRLLDPGVLDRVNRENQVLFEHLFEQNATIWESGEEAQAEIVPTMAALAPLNGCRVLEYGCGNGRFTVRIAPEASLVMALDFSLTALRNLSRRTDIAWPIALVQADCTRPVAQPATFDRMLCTLTSNLPSRTHRCDLFQAAAAGLSLDGRFVFSAHHYNLRARLRRVPRSGYYGHQKIYRYLSGRRELVEETRTAFDSVECRPIVVSLPFTHRFGLATAVTSLRLEKIPLLNHFGELLLVTAREPRLHMP